MDKDQKKSGMCRRDFPRISRKAAMTVMKLEYPVTDGEAKPADIKDMSRQGVCFITAEFYEPGTMLNIAIELRGWQHYLRTTTSIVDAATMSKPLTAIAEVVWSKKLAPGCGYEVGVRFKDIYEDDLQAFNEYLSRLFGKDD
jgi:hypothetical protein